MGHKRKSRTGFVVLLGLILISFLGLWIAYTAINTAVKQRFGQAASDLSTVQKWVYPVELFVYRKTLTSPLDAFANEQGFEISQGESVAIICLRLEQMGMIDDAELMRTYLVYSGLDRQLKSGQFKLSAAMSPIQISEALIDASSKEGVVTILPGWRIEEVALNVEGSGLDITADSFIQAAYAPSPQNLALLPVSELVSLEGFLFPGSYVFEREANLAQVLERILDAFAQSLDPTLIDAFTRQGLTIQEAVTLASIVEKEAVIDDEKPLIASVFYNRLAEGMRLETDPTVQYALGYQEAAQSWWKSPLLLTDLAVDSPYNTYIVNGLPPTPICNPSLESLRAVAFPAETPYFYFRAACDGSGRHSFAITFEEHLNNSCE